VNRPRAISSRALRIEGVSGNALLVRAIGQNDLRQHFGLGPATRVDRLEIRWPSGRTEALENIEANQIVTIREGNGITIKPTGTTP